MVKDKYINKESLDLEFERKIIINYKWINLKLV